MEVKFKARSGTSGGGRKPYYVDKGTILEAKQNFERGFSDLSIELMLDIGKEFNPRLFIDSKWTKDDKNVIVGEGTVFKIGEVFSRLGVDVTITDEAPIDPTSLQELVGKEVWYIRYISKNSKGETKYRYLDAIQNGSWAGGGQNLERAFLKRFKEKGQPQAYDPSLVDAVTEEPKVEETETASEPAPF